MFSLKNDRIELALAPEAGGSIAAFRVDGYDVMRPATEEALAKHDPLGMASFPLVPYSNRIAHGRFRFDGRDVQLPLNFGDHPHAIHGQGWQHPWTVLDVDGTHARLCYEHEPDAWPWRYVAEQRFTLHDDGFEVALIIANRSDMVMPAGLGHHPYYPRTPGMRLLARLDGWWETDEHVMPVAHHPVEPARDWSQWLHADKTTDNVFSGWDGDALIEWPEKQLQLRVTASELARYLVVYSPTDEAICCIEPVTHPTDAINQPDTPNIRRLEPGTTMTLTTQFRVEAI